MASEKTEENQPRKREKNTYGAGEITEVTKGQVYRIRPRMGKDPRTGRYTKAPMKTIYGTKADARREMELYKMELSSATFINDQKLTISQYARQFQEQRRSLGNLSPLTIERDEIETDKIQELFGDIPIDALTVGIVNQIYAKLRADKSVSKSQLHKIHAKLKQVLKQAVKEEIITKNPCDMIQISRPKSKERKSLEIEDAIKLAEALRNEEQSGRVVAMWLGLATGIRRGEALGLLWKYVDFKCKQIYIAQQLASDKTFREPKSENSHRWIGIDDETVEYLKAWKERQLQELEEMCIQQRQDTPVVTNELGGITDPNNFSRWRRNFFADIGLGYFEKEETYTSPNGAKHTKRSGYRGYNFHELRHTQATLLIGNGADIKTVQSRLGHSSVSLTMNIYAHAIAANDRTAADTIGNAVFGSKNNKIIEEGQP